MSLPMYILNKTRHFLNGHTGRSGRHKKNMQAQSSLYASLDSLSWYSYQNNHHLIWITMTRTQPLSCSYRLLSMSSSEPIECRWRHDPFPMHDLRLPSNAQAGLCGPMWAYVARNLSGRSSAACRSSIPSSATCATTILLERCAISA